MAIFKFPSKKDNKQKLTEQPLNYWEEQSFLIAVPYNSSANIPDGIFDRAAAVKDVTLKKQAWNEEEGLGSIIVGYQGEEYAIGFHYGDFSAPDMRGMQMQRLSQSEIEAVQRAEKALTVFMEFKGDPKVCYQLQLKMIAAMVSDFAAVMDESAEQLLSSRWVRMTVDSSVVPSAEALYSVQAVSAENGEVWLHTHGLCRCGLTELEILDSDTENYQNHYNIINNLASRLIDKKDDIDLSKEEGIYIGKLNDGRQVVAVIVPWTEALGEYPDNILGGPSDREQGHNTKTSAIFLYKNQKAEDYHILSKVSIYNELWGENAMFFISNEETERMKTVARERFKYVKQASADSENTVIIKIGLEIDEKYKNEAGSGTKEHIWFELLGFEGDSFRAVLTQEPYWAENIHEGYEGTFTVNDVTDWIIFTPECRITPENAYILED